MESGLIDKEFEEDNKIDNEFEEKENRINSVIELVRKIYPTREFYKGSFCSEKVIQTSDKAFIKKLNSCSIDQLDQYIKILKNTIGYISKLKLSGISLELRIESKGENCSNLLITELCNINLPDNKDFTVALGQISNGCVVPSYQLLDRIMFGHYSFDLTELNFNIQPIKIMEYTTRFMSDNIRCSSTVWVSLALESGYKNKIEYHYDTIDNIIKAILNRLDNMDKVRYTGNRMMTALEMIKIFNIILKTKLMCCVPEGKRTDVGSDTLALTCTVTDNESTVKYRYSKSVVGVRVATIKYEQEYPYYIELILKEMYSFLLDPIDINKIKVEELENNNEADLKLIYPEGYSEKVSKLMKAVNKIQEN
jgi:hypothetical protein